MDSIVHFEIPFDDKERAQKFYKESFGWSFADWPTGDKSYTGVFTTEVGEDQKPVETGKINGGMVPRSLTAHPVLVMRVEDLDAALEKVVANGGEVGELVEYPGAGTAAYAKDTEGNTFALWKDAGKK